MERLSVLLVSLLCCAWIHTSSVEGTFSYSGDHTTSWRGTCAKNTGHQSPINIVTANVSNDTNLSGLFFSSSWNRPVNGSISTANQGHNIQVTLNSSSTGAFTTNTSLGNYQLMRIEFHWGNVPNGNNGSEHLVDGRPAQLEIQFMLSRMDAGNAGNINAVIAVLADEKELLGERAAKVWSTLFMGLDQLSDKNTSSVTVAISPIDLLPTDRDYYYYPGSLTTPPCTESVQWFVLKNRIPVSERFMDILRVSTNTENMLTFNFRMPRPLGNRTVSTPAVITTGSSAVITTSSLIAVLTVALLAIAGLN